MIVSRKTSIALVASALLATACGTNAVTVSNPTDRTPTAQRLVGCGDHKYSREALEGPIGAEATPHPAGQVLREQIELSSGAEMTPTREWRILRMDRDLVVFGGGDFKKRGRLKAELEVGRAVDEWKFVHIDFDCGIHIDTNGQTLVDFAVAPGTTLDAKSVAIDLLILNRNCGGSNVLERLNEPLIEYDRDSVGVLLTAEPNPGMHTCQGFPPSEYRLELSEPFGDRVLMDVSSYPPFPPGDAEELR